MKKEAQEIKNISEHIPVEYDKKQHKTYRNRVARYKKVSKTLAIIVVLGGVASVLGWVLNIPFLRGEFSNFPGTKFYTAILFIMAGVSLYLLNCEEDSKKLAITRVLSIIIIIWSALTFLEYVSGLNIIFPNLYPSITSTVAKSRILSSINFVIIGMALLMSSYKYKIRLIQIIACIYGFIALLGLSAYFYGRSDNYVLDLIVQMAMLSSLIHICFSLGILCLFPDKEYTGRVTAQNNGGYMARRLLPINLGAVFVIGILITIGNQYSFYSDEFSLVLTIVTTMAFLTGIIIWNAKMLNKLDSERQESKEELFKIQKFYEEIVEGINEGIWVTDKNDRLYFTNRGMEKISRVKTKDMKGMNILKDIPPDISDVLEKYYTKAKDTLTPVQYDSIPVPLTNGKYSYHSGWIIPQIYNGNFNGAICTVIDHTKRDKAEKALKKSEAYYRTIFESTGTATIIIGEDRVIKMANKMSEEFIGYNLDEIENKMEWTRFVHPDDLERLKKYHKMRRTSENQVPSEYEFRLIDKEQNERQIMLYASLIPGTNSSVVSLLDITQRKKSELAIKNSLKEKELLLQEIHHRVKNNMQIISSLLNLQHSFVEDEEIKTILKDSQSRVKSMALVHEKLYQTDDLAEINAAEYIRSLTTSMFNNYSVQSGVELILDVGEVFFDIDTAVPMGLVINELVSNSLKYAFPDDKTGKIYISLQKSSEEGKYILKVEDDGVGFPEDIDFLNSRSLGLQLVKTLVDQLDGTVELDCSNGASFKINIKQNHYTKRI
jgi:PAS domain S-box-containing protein